MLNNNPLQSIERMFTQKSSGIDFFIKILLELGSELLVLEMQKHMQRHRLCFGGMVSERPPKF